MFLLKRAGVRRPHHQIRVPHHRIFRLLLLVRWIAMLGEVRLTRTISFSRAALRIVQSGVVFERTVLAILLAPSLRVSSPKTWTALSLNSQVLWKEISIYWMTFEVH